ncbi:hypothetical protein SISNIDRAFT_502714 [Sistotremastrum niveocremeum HHB9708]|uniref:Uncharacterized protein n=1 Tax=Sistotremastrum niveocremeum HHB9708 TaxID=1314777 RepID=A0A164M9E8_9AGAM|nr:hypothetical protein SISNIDRAFT_502714 [Sistotremastrum niveocremeum HHB9708]
MALRKVGISCKTDFGTTPPPSRWNPSVTIGLRKRYTAVKLAKNHNKDRRDSPPASLSSVYSELMQNPPPPPYITLHPNYGATTMSLATWHLRHSDRPVQLRIFRLGQCIYTVTVTGEMVVWFWPLDIHGRPVPPADLDSFCQRNKVAKIHCLCHLQGRRGFRIAVFKIWVVQSRASRFYGKVVAGCHECRIFSRSLVCLEEYFAVPHFPTKRYPQSATLLKGLYTHDHREALAQHVILALDAPMAPVSAAPLPLPAPPAQVIAPAPAIPAGTVDAIVAGIAKLVEALHGRVPPVAANNPVVMPAQVPAPLPLLLRHDNVDAPLDPETRKLLLTLVFGQGLSLDECARVLGQCSKCNRIMSARVLRVHRAVCGIIDLTLDD